MSQAWALYLVLFRAAGPAKAVQTGDVVGKRAVAMGYQCLLFPETLGCTVPCLSVPRVKAIAPL